MNGVSNERSWRLQDTGEEVDDERAVWAIRERLARELFEAWFESPTGARLAVVTNGERAMVVLLDDTAGPGHHATDPEAGPSASGGYALSNGQVDSYPDRDTVTLERALEIVRCVISGEDPPCLEWSADG